MKSISSTRSLCLALLFVSSSVAAVETEKFDVGLRGSSATTGVYNAPPSLRDLAETISQDDLYKFRSIHDIRDDAELQFQNICETNAITVKGGVTYALDGMKPMDVLAKGAKCTIDGVMGPCEHIPHTFTKQIDEKTILVTKNANGVILTIDVMGKNGSDSYYAEVAPCYFVHITQDMIDPDKLKFNTEDILDDIPQKKDVSA